MFNIDEIRERFKYDRYAINQTGVVIDEVSDNYAKCSFEVQEHHLNMLNSVMGGAIFTLADFAFAVAANAGDRKVVSVSSSANFLSAGVCKKLTAEAVCIKDGRSTTFYEVTVTDENLKKIAVISFTGFVVK